MYEFNAEEAAYEAAYGLRLEKTLESALQELQAFDEEHTQDGESPLYQVGRGDLLKKIEKAQRAIHLFDAYRLF